MSIAAFALSLALQQAPAAPAAPPATQPAKDLFAKSKCIACHGEDGRGDTEKGRKFEAPDFTTAKWSDETTDKEIRETILDGTKDKKGNVRMPAYRKKLTPAQIEELANYVRSFVRR